MAIERKLTTTVSTKGQVILPKSIRNERHWEAGTKLLVENTPEGVLLRASSVIPETRPEAVFGMLRRRGAARTIEEMDAGVVAEARRKHARN